PHTRHYRLALFVIILSLFNFLFLIFPYGHAQNYPPLAIALEMNQAWPQDTVIYYGSANLDNSLFRYFNPHTKWKQLPADLAVFDNEVRDNYAHGTPAWLEASAIDQLSAKPEGVEWLKKQTREETRHAFVNKAYNLRFIQVVPVEQ
ncbi:MAG: hypothetical protein ABJB97_03505, partial [Acidobacteriota bacterium]